VDAERRTAKVLGGWVKTLAKQPDAVLLLGDNFYGTLKGIDDTRWDSTFRQVYPPEIFKMDFYFLLGNHDFEDGQQLNWKYEIAYAASGRDARWRFPVADPKDTWYCIDLPTNDDPLVTLLMFKSSVDAMTSKQAAKKHHMEHNTYKGLPSHRRCIETLIVNDLGALELRQKH